MMASGTSFVFERPIERWSSQVNKLELASKRRRRRRRGRGRTRTSSTQLLHSDSATINESKKFKILFEEFVATKKREDEAIIDLRTSLKSIGNQDERLIEEQLLQMTPHANTQESFKRQVVACRRFKQLLNANQVNCVQPFLSLLFVFLLTASASNRHDSQQFAWPIVSSFNLVDCLQNQAHRQQQATPPASHYSAPFNNLIAPINRFANVALQQQQQQQQQQQSGTDHLLLKRQAAIADDQLARSNVKIYESDDAPAPAPAIDSGQHAHYGNAAGANLVSPPQPLRARSGGGDDDDDAEPQFEHNRLGSIQALALRSSGSNASGNSNSKLHIVRLFAPDSIQNGTQNVTLDCMFKFDPKLDQRLTIKWFFNDELEPIYQWIPELNKRVYSDKYEHLIDKSYQVSEDVDWMLQEYKLLVGEQSSTTTPNGANSELDNSDNSYNNADDNSELQDGATTANQQRLHHHQQQQQLVNNRKLLANRLNRLAKLGSDHSKQLLKTLRSMLFMDSDESSKYRALRLIEPTLSMAGRYTCSISSLDGDDLQSTKLIVYEPPTSFAFTVTRTPAGQMYNLTCRAGATYPRPVLSLYRYRAGQPEAGHQQQSTLPAASTLGLSSSGDKVSTRHAHRPRLAATQLRQEPLAGTQTQLTIGATKSITSTAAGAAGAGAASRLTSNSVDAAHSAPSLHDLDSFTAASNDIVAAIGTHSASEHANELTNPNKYDHDHDNGSDAGELAKSVPPNQYKLSIGAYEISAWALVDESSLSSNLVTQFECVLTIEGTNYEQRQLLALQKGWHVNSQAIMARSTLVGLMSVLASILCLTVALVSALLVFRLMRRHANKSSRVHQTSAVGSAATSGSLIKKRAAATATTIAAAAAAQSQRGQTNRSCELDSSTVSQASSPSSPASSAAGSTETSAASSSRSGGGGGGCGGGGGGGGTSGAIHDQAHIKFASASLASDQPHVNRTTRQQQQQPQQQQRQFGLEQAALPAMARQVQYSSFNGGQHARQAGLSAASALGQLDCQSDGIYRVPETHHQRQWNQQQQQHQFFGGGTRFVIGAGSERQSTVAWPSTEAAPYSLDNGASDRMYQKRLAASSSSNYNSKEEAVTATGILSTAAAAASAANRGQLSGMLRAMPSSSGAMTSSGQQQQQQQASSRHAPATISVNGKQLYC